MIKYFCDACEKEIYSNRNLNKFEYLCHIDEYFTIGVGGYVDLEDVSGRSIIVGLCAACYNRIVIEAVKKLKELQGNIKDKKLEK